MPPGASPSPLELMERLARFIPLPRMHRNRYHRVLAPNAKLRAAVVAVGRPEVEDPHLGFLDPTPLSELPGNVGPARPRTYTLGRAPRRHRLIGVCPKDRERASRPYRSSGSGRHA